MSKEITTDLASKALEYLNGIEAFVVTEAPLFVAEIYQWAIIKNSIKLSIGSLVLIFGIWLLYKCKKSIYPINNDRFNEDLSFGYGIGGAVSAILGVAAFLKGLLTLVKINVAPRLYLVEFFKDFV